jgi:hypothetical protein
VCCKPPRYGPNKARIIDKLSHKLDAMGITEDNFGPWGALCVLAAKPNQDHVHWSEYVFCLCFSSYRNLNALTCPFAVPITQCNNAILKVKLRQFNATSQRFEQWLLAAYKPLFHIYSPSIHVPHIFAFHTCNQCICLSSSSTLTLLRYNSQLVVSE